MMGVHNTVDQNSEGEKDGRSSVHDDPGKSFFILVVHPSNDDDDHICD